MLESVGLVTSCTVKRLGAGCRASARSVAYHRQGSDIRGQSTLEDTPKTQGGIEAAICEDVAHFHQENMGRGPKEI